MPYTDAIRIGLLNNMVKIVSVFITSFKLLKKVLFEK